MTLPALNALYPCSHRPEGARCPVCSPPRRTTEIVFDIAIARNLTLRGAVALLREIRGGNVVQFKPRRLRRSA